GVAGGGAHHGLGAGGDRGGHRHGHAAVLEGPGRVHALDLQVHLGAGELAQGRGEHQGRTALAQGDNPGVFVNGQAFGIFADDSAPLVGHLVSFNSQDRGYFLDGGQRGDGGHGGGKRRFGGAVGDDAQVRDPAV